MSTFLNLIAATFGMVSAVLWFRAAQIQLTYRFNKKIDFVFARYIIYGGYRKSTLRMVILVTARLNAYAAICAGIAMTLNATAMIFQ